MSVIAHVGFAGLSIQIELRPAGLHRCRERIRRAGVDEIDGDSPFRCGTLQPVPQSPIHDLRRDDVVAGPQRQKYGGRSRHPRCEGEAGCPALEPVQQRFRLNECRVCRTTVGIAGPILVVGIANESGRRMHRGNQRLGQLVDPSERLGGHCRWVTGSPRSAPLGFPTDCRAIISAGVSGVERDPDLQQYVRAAGSDERFSHIGLRQRWDTGDRR